MANSSMPYAHMPRIATMKAYVGIAKNDPDSRMPRRLMAARTITMSVAKVASCPLRGRIAAAAYCAPDEMDTATVRT